jgi:hypothetical protein
MALQEAIDAIYATEYVELVDALDYIQLTVIERDDPDISIRAGRPNAFDDDYARSTNDYATICASYRHRVNKAAHDGYIKRALAVMHNVRALPEDELRFAYKIGRLRQRDIAPIPNYRRTATGEKQSKGSVRVKKIGGNPYLYYTKQLIGGGLDRRTKKLKTTYIGRTDLAEWLQLTLPPSRERKRRLAVLHYLRDLYNAGELTDDVTVETLEAYLTDYDQS